MTTAINIAQYFLHKDSDRILFNRNLVSKNGRDFYEENARLNKYLHLAQNLYIAKTGALLFSEQLSAYDNGAVVLEVLEKYSILWSEKNIPEIDPPISEFLDRVFIALQNASLDELIEISHEDSEWVLKHTGRSKADQIMDSLSRKEEYQQQYYDILKVMDRMSS